MNSNNVPMMFRAQVQGRCQLHRVEKSKQRQDAEKWVDEWKSVFPKDALSSEDKFQPLQPISKPQKHNSSDRRTITHPVQNNLALVRAKPSPAKSPQSTKLKVPQFGSQIKTWEYTISWRLVSNSGQDEGVIRPIISANGFPYYPGASMKGAFLRACKPICTDKETENYCGKKLADGSSNPGILRFHGAYPVNMDWTQRLVDIVHRQDEKQVIKDDISSNANAQISLYQIKLKFGISSCKTLSESEWEKIKHIWETALAEGIGSRVSAGYGHFQEVQSHKKLLQIKIKGQGGTSQLVNGTKEFRPNMFKATLRGHTLRLLGGMTDEETAKSLTQKLWGGFGTKSSIVGLLGINFDFHPANISWHKNQKFYDLQHGKLNIFCMHQDTDDNERVKLIAITEALIKFTLMFGGFGKSWRRACHKQFYKQSYFENSDKPVIGCHWQFIQESQSLYCPVDKVSDITQFINQIRDVISTWIPQNKSAPQGIETWREAWYQPKVQVWGRLAINGRSKAIDWFHQPYKDTDSIKNPRPLAGSINPQKTGRIWHRMYPRFIRNKNGDIVRSEGYVELLTIFPDESEGTQKFMTFLRKESGFENIW
ncbi:MAG: hypothetical protein FWK04_14435 [Nostoc sp. GBBB01]|nr:hypothetical protein [Nostoc sp. GBBB01]